MIWKHTLGRLGVAIGDTICETGEIKCELRHVEPVGTCELLQLIERDQMRNQTLQQLIGKAVESSIDRRVGSENAAFSHLGEIIKRFAGADVVRGEPVTVEQIKGEECGMPLIEMIGMDAEAECPQQADAAEAKPAPV
jgi:hypothetical protein